MKYDTTSYYIPTDKEWQELGFIKSGSSNSKEIGNIINSRNEVYFHTYAEPFKSVLDFTAPTADKIKYINLNYIEFTCTSKYKCSWEFNHDYNYLLRFKSREEFEIFLWQIEMLDTAFFKGHVYEDLNNYKQHILSPEVLLKHDFFSANSGDGYMLYGDGVQYYIKFLKDNWIEFSLIDNKGDIPFFMQDDEVFLELNWFLGRHMMEVANDIDDERDKYYKLVEGKISLRVQSDEALNTLLWQLRMINN